MILSVEGKSAMCNKNGYVVVESRFDLQDRERWCCWYSHGTPCKLRGNSVVYNRSPKIRTQGITTSQHETSMEIPRLGDGNRKVRCATEIFVQSFEEVAIVSF